jgi:type IV pilus assembly protein PilP
MILMIVAFAGCGDHSEVQPTPEPPVIRKKITMPKEPLSKVAQPEEEVPQVAAPVTEPGPEVPVSAEKPEEQTVTKPDPGAMVKRPIVQPAKVEPQKEEKAPLVPSEQEAQVPVKKTEGATGEPQVVKDLPPEAAKAEPSPDAKEPLVRPGESTDRGPLEAIGKRPPYSYDPKGKIDPFKPLFEIEAERVVTAKKKVKKKRVPLTPLQKVSLAQLKVVGVMLLPTGNKALVEDPSGKSYIVREGTYIGQNFGQVKEILKDRVVVEEDLEDFVTGKMKLQRTELALRKNAGEM